MEYSYFGSSLRFDLGSNNVIDTSDDAHFFIKDEAGNVIASVDKTGALETQFEYDAWGNDLSDSFDNSQDINCFRSGKYFDDKSGLYYNQARWYDPALGRFISESPISPYAEEEYVYCGNDCVNNVDVNGLFWSEIGYALSFDWIPGVRSLKDKIKEKVKKPFFSNKSNERMNDHYRDIATILGEPFDPYTMPDQACKMTADEIVTSGLYFGLANVKRFGGARYLDDIPSSHLDVLSKNKAQKAIEGFVGKGATTFRNDAGDLIIQSLDELREVRFDINSFHPHDGPHIHVIEYGLKKGKKVIKTNERIFLDE